MKNFNSKNVKQIGLIIKPSESAIVGFNELKKSADRFDFKLLIEENSAKFLGESGVCFDELENSTQMLISLGGDGTLLSVCRRSNLPVLGIHAGRLGFLTDIQIAQISSFFEQFFAGKFKIEHPLMLEVEISYKSGKIESKTAFNDIVIMRKKANSVVKINAFLEGKLFNSYNGDGVIIATAIGSTAYNLSAGGAIIYPLSEVYTLTPICSHSLTQRPVIVDKNFSFCFEGMQNALVVIDGQDEHDMAKISRIKVAISDKRASLIRHDGYNYFEVLKDKLGWGQND